MIDDDFHDDDDDEEVKERTFLSHYNSYHLVLR